MSQSSETNYACPFCKAKISGDPFKCPSCGRALRLKSDWFDVANASGVKGLGFSVVSLVMLLFSIYSLLQSSEALNPNAKSMFTQGAVAGLVGFVIFAMLSFRHYAKG
jgi:hypothetical protein